jgi:putative PIN family toxin of toxin-antitoxin system
MIVVVDTSVLVSAALKVGSPPEQALLAAITPPNRVITTQEIEDEYQDVLFRPKFSRFASILRRQWALDTILVFAEQLAVPDAVRVCRDPRDDKFLALAAAGGARVILSSDDDLQALNPWRGVQILGPADFLALSDLGSP